MADRPGISYLRATRGNTPVIYGPGDAFPVALGVLYEDPAPTFESAVIEQNAAAAAGKTPDLQKLVSQGQTWQVEKEPRAE